MGPARAGAKMRGITEEDSVLQGPATTPTCGNHGRSSENYKKDSPIGSCLVISLPAK